MTENEFNKLKGNKKLYNKFRRNLNKTMNSKIDVNHLKKISKETGFAGIKSHYVGHRNKRIKYKK